MVDTNDTIATINTIKTIATIDTIDTIAMADDDYDGEGSGLELIHVSDFLDYLGKIVRMESEES